MDFENTLSTAADTADTPQTETGSPVIVMQSGDTAVLCLQQGHTYFRVLLRFGGSVLPPVCVPPFPVFPPALGGGVQPPPLFIWISAHPCVMM